MQTLLLDTNSVIKKLEQRGFSRAQAEGITDALKELDASSLVTKTDLELALAKTTTMIITWMTGALLAQGALVVALIQYLQIVPDSALSTTRYVSIVVSCALRVPPDGWPSQNY